MRSNFTLAVIEKILGHLAKQAEQGRGSPGSKSMARAPPTAAPADYQLALI